MCWAQQPGSPCKLNPPMRRHSLFTGMYVCVCVCVLVDVWHGGFLGWQQDLAGWVFGGDGSSVARKTQVSLISQQAMHKCLVHCITDSWQQHIEVHRDVQQDTEKHWQTDRQRDHHRQWDRHKTNIITVRHGRVTSSVHVRSGSTLMTVNTVVPVCRLARKTLLNSTQRPTYNNKNKTSETR